MYELADVLPDAELDPGSNILVVGPPMSGKRNLALDILAHGNDAGEGAIIVSTKDNAEKLLDVYADHVSDVDSVPLGIVDCVTKQQGTATSTGDPRIKYTSSPRDMTRIGIDLSDFLEEFYTNRGIKKNRILLYSLSPLLMYSNLQTVFRFLHVFTGRVQSADALGVFVIDSTAHDDQEMNTLKQLFDGVIEVSEDGEPTLTLVGA